MRLIHIRTKGEAGSPPNPFKPPSQQSTPTTIPRRHFFCGYFMFPPSCARHAPVRVHPHAPCGDPPGKDRPPQPPPLAPNCEPATPPLARQAWRGTQLHRPPTPASHPLLLKLFTVLYLLHKRIPNSNICIQLCTNQE